MDSKDKSYKHIFKTTFLFGFVQVFKAIIGISKNKIVAILLGAEGIGIIGIFSSTISLIQTGAGLGINQSAVRSISEANAAQDRSISSRIISITNQIVLYSGLLGCIVTLVLSSKISHLTMGDNTYTISYVFLSGVVALNIINEGRLAILKGMRRLRLLAYASMIGSVVGFVTAVPLYYFFGKNGIVPELLIASISGVLVSNWFVRKISYEKTRLPVLELLKEASPMIKMGTALMIITFLDSIVTLIVASYIRKNGGFDDVGFYNAGKVIMSSYFGILITALMTDYYPRIAAVNKDNNKLSLELNQQSAVSLVLCCPLFVIFLFLLPFFIQILYTEEFIQTVDFVKYGIYGTLITICSNQVDMILVAKFKMKLFTIICVVYRAIQLILSIVMYKYYGLIGLGITLTIMGVLHMVIMTTVVYKLYHISYNRSFVKIAIVVLLFAIVATIANEIENILFKYVIGSLLILGSCLYTLLVAKHQFNLDVFQLIRDKIGR